MYIYVYTRKGKKKKKEGKKKSRPHACAEIPRPSLPSSSSVHGQPISINPVSDQIGARSEPRIYAASDRMYYYRTNGCHSFAELRPLRERKLYPRIDREKFRV